MGSGLADEGDRESERERDGITMVPKCHLVFTPVPQWVMHSSASEEQSEHTPFTSTSTAQGPPPSASTPSTISTPPTAEPLPSSILETHAIMQASEYASSNRTFCGPIRMAHVWNRQHQVMVYYDAEERAQRLTFDGCYRQKSDMEEDMDKGGTTSPITRGLKMPN
ncbi:hypothetical protein COCNU_03G005500 [Cocos nucifera]|uniref:Uncharacterized protein n=1 Tax=Cocos nucifera TaxID=13894 RepID=A0A8K0I310_COCNU|nr:hypothetical protein COCNU_03G005500 [Cocos nucifera]